MKGTALFLEDLKASDKLSWNTTWNKFKEAAHKSWKSILLALYILRDLEK